MRKLYYATVSAALIVGASPTSVWATSDSGPQHETDGYVQQAFTLDEMNCFSSDIRALEDSPPSTASQDTLDEVHLAVTNSIPCNARDPKAPPKKKKRS